MKKQWLFESIEEITSGELLTLNDYTGLEVLAGNMKFHMQLNELPDTEYDMYSPEIYKSNMSHTESRNYRINSAILAKDLLVPFFKNKTTYTLVTKWNHPQLYAQHDLGMDSDKNSYYQIRILHLQIAGQLYKDLVEEILPLFEEGDREIVKCRILNDTLVPINKSASYYMVEIKEEIIDHTSGKNKDEITPSALIAIWEKFLGITSAMAVECDKYDYVVSRANYATALERHTAGKPTADDLYILETKELNPDNPNYNTISIVINNNTLIPVKQALTEFHRLKPNGIPLTKEQHQELIAKENSKKSSKRSTTSQILEGIYESKPPKALLLPMQVAYSAQRALTNLYFPLTHSRDEISTFINYIDNYKPMYTTPKKIPLNESIDQSIVFKEKNLISDIILITSMSNIDILTICNKCLDLLNLIKMRYSISLNKQNKSYFGIFESTTEYNKNLYSKIFEAYIKNIIAKCIKVIVDRNELLTSNMQDNIGISVFIGIINECKEHLNIDDLHAVNALIILEKLSDELQILEEAMSRYKLKFNENEERLGLKRRSYVLGPT